MSEVDEMLYGKEEKKEERKEGEEGEEEKGKGQNESDMSI